MTTDMAEEDFIEALNNECIRLRQEIQTLQKCCDEFKLRTCENCKYGEPDDCFTTVYCLNGVKECTNGSNSLDFGCNKFEKKA